MTCNMNIENVRCCRRRRRAEYNEKNFYLKKTTFNLTIRFVCCVELLLFLFVIIVALLVFDFVVPKEIVI